MGLYALDQLNLLFPRQRRYLTGLTHTLHHVSETFLKMLIFLIPRDNAMRENVWHTRDILPWKAGGM
jgi:hypothetical protein